MVDDFTKNLIIYDYKRLTFAGITGEMKESLSNTGILIKNNYSDLEVSPIQLQPKRDFLALFGFNPVLDITIDQYSPLESSIVGYALDKDKLFKKIGKISDLIGFKYHKKQNPEVAQTWKDEFEIEKNTYYSCETIANTIKQPL